jgi:apolipoprotein N-acyltransferase
MNEIDPQSGTKTSLFFLARSGWSALILPFLSMLMLSAVFPTISFWWLTPVALTPLIMAALRSSVNKKYLLYIWLLTSSYYVLNLYWLSGITVPGYIALSIYCGLFLALFFLLTHLLARINWLPIWLSAPVVFTALEYLRGHLFTGFPWFTLGVAFTGSLVVLQSASLFGASGLSFLAVMTSAVIADVVDGIANGKSPTRRATAWSGVALIILLWSAVIGYGLLQLKHPPYRRGPRVAVLQQNIPQSVKSSNSISNQKRLFNSYFKLSLQAERLHPDLIAWPETMVPGFLNPSWLAQSPAWYARGHGRRMLMMDQQFAHRLTGFAKKYHTAVLVGSSGVRFNQAGKISSMQNIAVLFTPNHGENRRYYAKRHLVPFGEYLPFKHSAPWLHHLLSYFTPFGPNGDYSLTPGSVWRHFTLHVGSRSWRFASPICYEDAMAGPARAFCRPKDGVKGADFLVVISNDGWYQSRAELLQHLQLDQLRAVENRVSVARCVNGGYCGFINPSGRIFKLVSQNGRHAFVAGVAAADMPLDNRVTVFQRGGYLFPRVMLAVAVMMVMTLLADWFIRRQKRRRTI